MDPSPKADATRFTLSDRMSPTAKTPGRLVSKRFKGLGLEVETAEHASIHWRSLYVTDFEENQVELVCYDSSV